MGNVHNMVIGTHNEVSDLSKQLATYSGKDLGAIYTPGRFKLKVADGNFSGLSLGDYFDITLTTREVMRYVISGFNTYLNFGNTALTSNHVIMTPLDCMASSTKMQESDDNRGGYAGSLMPAYLETVFTTFPTEWQSIILPTPRMENNKSDFGWATRKLFLLSETEVNGHPVWSTNGFDGGTRPLPLFQYSARYRVKGRGFGTSASGVRSSWWLASPTSAYNTDFCIVSHNGSSSSTFASNFAGVAPCFCVGANVQREETIFTPPVIIQKPALS